MYLLTPLAACIFLAGTGLGVEILTEESTIFLDGRSQSDVTLPCRVKFDAGAVILNHPITWEKCQDLANRDATSAQEEYCWKPIHRGLGVVSPFYGDGRYTINSHQIDENEFEYRLNITNVAAQDSGLYRCYVPVDNSGRYTSVIKTLNVQADLVGVHLSGATDASVGNAVEDSPSFTYKVGTKGYVECRIEGGYPEPHITLRLGEDQITGHLLEDEENPMYTLEGETEGLQTIKYMKRLKTENLEVSVEDQGKMLTCEATVPGENDSSFDSKEREAEVIVHYAPIFDDTCKSEYITKVGEKGFKISCGFKARPTSVNIEFTIKATAEKIRANEVDGYEAKLELDGDRQVASLTITEVLEEHLQDYSLAVTNEVGRTVHEFAIRDSSVSSDGSESGASSVSAFSLLLVLALVISISFLHQ